MSLSNQTYNTLKWIAQILLPAPRHPVSRPGEFVGFPSH